MAVKLTNAAIERLKQIKNNSDNLIPRVEIVAGGCNGFEKRFNMGTQQPTDKLINVDGVDILLIDEISYTMLENSQIDFKTGLNGGNFTIEIPESTSSCGCGDSFSL